MPLAGILKPFALVGPCSAGPSTFQALLFLPFIGSRASGLGSAPFFFVVRNGVPTELIEPPRDCLPCGDALFVPGDSRSADALGNEARSIFAVLAFNLAGAGPKLAIIWHVGKADRRWFDPPIQYDQFRSTS